MTAPVPVRASGPPRSLLVRKVGMPLAVLIVIALLAAAIMGLPALANPGMYALGLVPSLVAFGVGAAALLWLDRWEPEPPRLLIFAALWGASVSVLIALGLEIAFTDDNAVGTAIAGPAIEEFAKGTLLLVLITGRRRRELTTVLDHLVYAGLCGLGFALAENLLYLSGSSNLGELGWMIVVRLGLKVWGHPLYAMVLALGIYLARQPGPWWRRLVAVPAGFVGATALHGIWNGSLYFELWVTAAVYVLALLPSLGLVIWSGMRERRREGALVAAEMPALVASGLLDPALAGTLAALPARRTVLGRLPRQVRPAYRELADAVAELAFVNDRIADAGAVPRLLAQRQELLARIVTARDLLPPG